MADPMHQFQIKKIVELPTVTVPGLGAIDLSITNSVAAMMLAAALVMAFYTLAARRAVIPGRLQAVGEMLYGLVDGLAESIIGHEGKKFLPFIFTLFAFVLVMNIQGMFLVFTSTSQLAVTLTLGLMVILTVVAVGFAKNGAHNLTVLNNLPCFADLGYPLLVGPSRKRFIGELTGAPANDRLGGTIAAVTACVMGGANIVRVHDVAACKQAVIVADAIRRA